MLTWSHLSLTTRQHFAKICQLICCPPACTTFPCTGMTQDVLDAVMGRHLLAPAPAPGPSSGDYLWAGLPACVRLLAADMVSGEVLYPVHKQTPASQADMYPCT